MFTFLHTALLLLSFWSFYDAFSTLLQDIITHLLPDVWGAFKLCMAMLSASLHRGFIAETPIRLALHLHQDDETHAVRDYQLMHWESFARHLITSDNLEGCFPHLERRRKLRQRANTIRKWQKFAELIRLVAKSQSAGNWLLAESVKWKSRYRAIQCVESKRKHLLPHEAQMAQNLIDQAGALEDLRAAQGAKEVWILQKVRSYACYVGVESSHEDMEANAQQLRKVLNSRAPTLSMTICPNLPQKLSMTEAKMSSVDNGHIQVHFAEDGYVISSLSTGGIGAVPTMAAQKGNIQYGTALVSWVNWKDSIANYESRRHTSDADIWKQRLETAAKALRTFATEKAFESEVYDQNRRTVAWAYAQSVARASRLEAAHERRLSLDPSCSPLI